MLIIPRLDPLEIPALVPRIEIRIRVGMTFHPIKCYDPDVAPAHDILSQHLDAMINMGPVQIWISFGRLIVIRVCKFA